MTCLERTRTLLLKKVSMAGGHYLSTRRIEGSTEIEPSEYRNAYGPQPRGSIAASDKPQHQELLRPPIRERSHSSSRRRESNNYWMDNDNGERFGTVNAAEDQDAFQILQTRVHEDNVVGKPPLGTRRSVFKLIYFKSR